MTDQNEAKKFIQQYDVWATQTSNNYADPDTRVVCPEPISFELEI